MKVYATQLGLHDFGNDTIVLALDSGEEILVSRIVEDEETELHDWRCSVEKIISAALAGEVLQ